MTKLLALGAAIAIALLWHELWLYAILFIGGYAGLLELYRHVKKNESDIAYIEKRHKSLIGLRRAHRRGL